MKITAFSKSFRPTIIKSVFQIIEETFSNQQPQFYISHAIPQLMDSDLVIIELSLYSDIHVLQQLISKKSCVIAIISNMALLRYVLLEDLSCILIHPFTMEELKVTLNKISSRLNTKTTTIKTHKTKTQEQNAIVYQLIQNKAKSSSGLTDRQLQLLRFISDGHLYKEVATQMGISVGTVKQHLHRIYEKLDVNNKIEAINKVGIHNLA